MENNEIKINLNKPLDEEKLEGNASGMNLLESFENAKKSLQADDIKSAQYFLNLVFLSQPLDFTAEVTALSMTSSIHFKLKDEDALLKVIRKILKLIKIQNVKLIHPQILLAFVKIISKAAQLFNYNDKTLITCWLYYLATNLYDENNLKSEDTVMEVIKENFPKTLIKLQGEISVIQQNFSLKKEKAKTLYNYFSKYSEIKYTIEKKEESFYLVSSSWVSNMVVFLKYYLDNSVDIEAIFNKNNICLLYFNQEDEVKKEIIGTYPGPINNFYLSSSTDNWTDKEESHTNTYINKNIQETSDYLIIPKGFYKIAKELFDINVEIERKSILYENKLQLEIHLMKIKVLYINEYLRDNNKELIKPRAIQFSKILTLSQFEKKIKRIFSNLVSKSEDEFDFKIYKHEKQQKNVSDLIVAYVNKDKYFKIVVKELKRGTDTINKTIEELGLGEKDVLIVEVIPTNTIALPFVRILSETLNCSLCNITVDSNEMIHCDQCKQNIYCSNNCKINDYSHIDYHKNIFNLSKKKLTYEDLGNIDISTFIDTNSKGGLVGLANLGNGSFINSALQCLSHCEDLTKYFLSKIFINEINLQNKSGSEGKVARAYYDLIKELWIGSKSSISPLDFKSIFIGFVKYAQAQDSNETVSFMLQKLHEDLNRVSSKQLVENFPQSKKENDIEASERWWKNHKSSNNSIIIDLFYGQHKTKIKCFTCSTQIITYEPFNYLSLDIPDNRQSKIRFKVFPNNHSYKYFFVEMFQITKMTTVKDVKDKIKENTSYKNSEFDSLLLTNKTITSVLLDDSAIYDYVYTKIDFAEENFTDYEIIFCEVQNSYQHSKNKGDYVTFFISPSIVSNERYYLLFNKAKSRPICYPKAFSISKQSRVKDLYMEVFKYYRRALDDMLTQKDDNTIDTSYYQTFYNNLDEKEFIEKEFDKYFPDNKLFNLYFVNNIPPLNSWIFSNYACEYCNSSKCNFCQINLSFETKIYELYARQKYTREIILLADFVKFKDNFKGFYEHAVDKNDPKIKLKGDVNIYDCLELFRKEEKLEKDNAPKICKCGKKQQEIYKKIEILKAPKHLIIQLKRFKFKGHNSLMDLVNNKKNETFVGFPLEGLDLSVYLAGQDKDIAMYDLYAISQHTGGIANGQFTALCNNKGIWNEFNDESVTKADLGEINSPKAYLLFYKQRDVEQKVDGISTNKSINNIL